MNNIKRDPLFYGVIGVLIGSIAVWIFTVSISNSNTRGIMRMMGVQKNSQNMMQSSQTIDAHFIEQMIPHHDDAITMSKLAQTKANRTEVKELAKNIITSQSQEIKQMKVWYKEWFGKEVPTGEDVMSMHGMMESSDTHMGMMGKTGDLQRLELAEDFDIAFIEDMIPHHQMAVMMANMLLSGTSRPEMQQLARNIISSQTKEIKDMRSWYTLWNK